MNVVDAELTLSVDDARTLTGQLFEAVGAPVEHAAAVADHLVESSLAGAHSHGMLRIPQYLDDVETGRVDPRASPMVERSKGGLTVINGRRGFGQVAVRFAVDHLARETAAAGVAAVAVHQAGHAGRIGAYVETLALKGFASVAFCSSPPTGHYVAPFGGAEGRFGTNPIAYAFPTASTPIVADFSTSAMSEGKVRYHRHRCMPLPLGVLRYPDGTPTANPDALSGAGALLQPLGGEHFGYKGSMLALLVELLTSVSIGDDPLAPTRTGNSVMILGFVVEERSRTLATQLASYIRSCAPAAGDAVLVPGDREQQARRRGEIEIDARTWNEIRRRARELRVVLP